MRPQSFLLPRGLRPLGIVFALCGIAFLIARFYFGIKPDVLEVKVFAVYSAYLDTKYFAVIKNQIAEEIGGALLLCGLFMVAFAKEKDENYRVSTIRLNSFLISTYCNALFLLLAILFIFGLGFVFVMMINLGFWLVVYIIVFRSLLYSDRRKKRRFALTE